MSIVTIDGMLKAIRSTLREGANKDPLVKVQVLIECDYDALGRDGFGDLAKMQDGMVRCQISDAQLSLPKAGIQ